MTLTAQPEASNTLSASPASIETDTREVPSWAVWYCQTDDTYWSNSDGPTCWFCGHTGVISHAPLLTSQFGADLDE